MPPEPPPGGWERRRVADPQVVKLTKIVDEELAPKVEHLIVDSNRLWQAVLFVCGIFMAGVVAAIWFMSLPTRTEVKEIRKELHEALHGTGPRDPGLYEIVRGLQRDIEKKQDKQAPESPLPSPTRSRRNR